MHADAGSTGIGFPRTVLAPAAAAMRLKTVSEPSARCSLGSLAQVDVLSSLFPVVRKLLGKESFAALAAQFVGAGQAISALPWLDEEFPRFLRAFGRGASIEYLADIAELEKARAKATRFTGTPFLSPSRLSSALRHPIDTMRLEFHPSVSLIRSRFPVVTIWELNQTDDECALEQWGAESALVAGCFTRAAVWRLSPGGFAFLGALLGGATWAAAIEVASGSDGSFDAGVSRRLLTEAGIVIRLRQRCWHHEADVHSI
jgi:Putative DNA-binding domain